MSRTVVIAPEAQAQLDALYDYIADAASADIALRFNDALLDQFESLRDFPVRGTARDDILPGLRTVGFRKRVTIAFVVEKTSVLVIGVFYGGQDFESILEVD